MQGEREKERKKERERERREGKKKKHFRAATKTAFCSIQMAQSILKPMEENRFEIYSTTRQQQQLVRQRWISDERAVQNAFAKK